MSGPWEQFQATEQGPWSQFAGAAVPQEPEEKQSAFRQVADIPLGFGKGVVQGVRMIADAFGAGSETSQKIKGAEEYLAGLMSAQAQNDQKEISRIMKDAEDKGVLEQVKAGFQAFAKAPVDLLTQAFGTAVPAIVGTLGAQVLGGGALVATGVGALTGAGMGAGVVKGSIYEETKKALKEAGANEQVAEEKAQQAQAYGGKNLDQILLGTVLGGVAAVGPLEKGAAGMLARRILGKVSGEEVAEQAAKGALRRRAEGAVIEAVPEALQAGQEQLAQNIALQREGFDVPTMRGVAGASTLEGLAGAGLGAISSGRPRVEPRAEAPAPEAPAPEAPLEPEFQPSDEDVELAPPETTPAEIVEPVTPTMELEQPPTETPSAEAIEPASGAGVPVAGGPAAVTPAEGVRAAEPVRVVPPVEDVGRPPEGARAEPRPVTAGEMPAADVAATPPLEPSIEERLQSLRDQQQALLTKSGKVPAPKSLARKQYDALEAEIQNLSVQPVDLVERPVFDVKPAEETLPSGKARKRPKSIMGSPMLADIFFSVGGLDTSLLSEFSTRFATKQLDRKGRPVIRYRNPMVSGFGNLFNNRGTTDFTEIATVLEDRGYLEPGSVERDSTEAGERAKELILKALNREEVLPVDEQAAKLAAEREEADKQADLERREENRAIAYGELQLDEEYMGPEDLQEALDLENEFATEMEIYNLEPDDFQFLSDQEFEEGLTDAERATAEARSARKAEQDTARKKAEAVPDGEAPAFDLERPTAERLKEQEERIKEAEKREAAAKRAAQESERKAREERELRVRAEQTVDDFELGKSAEEQMSGMEDMFKDEKPRKGTKEQLESADGHAKSVGGTVVYQDGDISLVRGHAILSGQPVYVVVNGNYRSKVDIESYTGNLITPQQKSDLTKIKNDIEKADEQVFKKSPFIRFDDGLAVSGSVPIEIAGIVRGWKDLLNLKPNLYVTTIEDAKANKDNFNGPHRAISSSGLDPNEAGSVRKLPNGDYYIAFKKGTSKSKMLEVLGHELGHMHEREVFNNADAQTKRELRDEHSKWLKSTKGLTAKQLVDSLRAKTSAKTTRIQKGLMADEMTPYWKSFSEWYADQVSRWSVTNEKPLSVVEKFFSRLGKALRNFYNKITSQGYLPNETFVQYLDKVNSQPGLIGTPTKNEPVQGESFMLKEAKAANEKFQARREEIVKKAVVEGSEAMQKRRLDKGAFEGVPEDLFEKLKPVFAPKSVTILERVYDMRDNFWQRVAQGMADQFRTIKDYSYDAYIKARLSKSIDGSLEGLMFYGQVFNDGGALNVKKNTRGMFEILKPIGKELDRYLIWIALNRDAMQPDSKRSISQDLVGRRDELSAGTLNGKPREDVYRQIQKEMNQLNRSVLKVAVDTGLLNTTAGAIKDIENNDKLSDEEKSEKIAELRKNPIGYERFINDLNYIPFYKIMEDGDLDSVSKAASASGLTSQQFSKALKGGERPFGDLMENTLKNWSHILSASMKNQAGVAAIKAAVDAGVAAPNLKPGLEFVDGKVYSTKTNKPVGDGELRAEQTEGGKGTVNVVQDGKKVYYVVSDPLLMDSITSIGYLGNQSKFLDVARNFKNLLQYGVTLSPQFKVNNLIRDSVAAMGVSELKLNPIANVMQGVSLSDRNNETYIEAMAGGGIFNFGTAYEGDQSKLIKRLLKMGVDRDHVLDAEDRITTGIKYAWNKYNEWGNRSENANRLSLYKQLREKGMSHLEATFKARDLMDFSMQGSWPAFRLLTQVVPFLNARVQGLYKLGRDGINPTLRVINNTVTGKEIDATDKQKAQQFSIVSMGVVMASALLYLAFKDDEEYKRRDDWDKDNFWWFRIPGMDFALRVPKPFEIGALGTLVERTLEQILDSGAEGKEFGEALFRMLTNTFAINPTPQFIKPLVDIYANKDSFSGAPIESAGLERLSRQERMVETTTPLAIALGKISSLFPEKFEMSPVQMDYLIKGYFGWLGGTIAATSTYAVMPFREGEYPDARWMDRMSLGLARELPGRGAKYVTAFYDANKEISQAYADMRHYAQIGDSEKVQKILEEKGDKIRLQKLYDGTAKQMANIRKQIRLVQTDKQMDGAAKKEAIDRMQDMISMLAKQAEDVRKSMKGERP